jgi:hypothetical protein
MGVFMLAWLISGILMVLPQHWFGAVTRHEQPAVDFRHITMSPGEAIKHLEQRKGIRLDVKQMQLQQIHDHLLYRIRADGFETGYIDSKTGEYFEFTPVLAEEITRFKFDISAPLLESTRLTEHDITYPFGGLPVFRVRFENDPGVSYFVSESNAKVSRSSALSRVRGAIVSLHIFEPIEILTGSRSLRKNLLLATGALSLLGAIVGLYLTLPVRRRNKQHTG